MDVVFCGREKNTKAKKPNKINKIKLTLLRDSVLNISPLIFQTTILSKKLPLRRCRCRRQSREGNEK
jgi:hypothetical protein